MTDKIDRCEIGVISKTGQEVCGIEEKDPERIKFFVENKDLDEDVRFHYELGETRDKEIFLRCQTALKGNHFHWNIRPRVNWLRLLCKTGDIHITDTKDCSSLVIFNLNLDRLRGELSYFPECKIWLEGEFE